MIKMFNKFLDFCDKHEREIMMTEFGFIGVLAGYALSDPSINEKVTEWAADKAAKLVKSIHVTIGDGKTLIGEGGGSNGANSRTDGKPLTYYDYLDRREQRQHEEHMAEIRMRNHIFADEKESKVE